MSAAEGAENLGHVAQATMHVLAPQAPKSVVLQAEGRTVTP